MINLKTKSKLNAVKIAHVAKSKKLIISSILLILQTEGLISLFFLFGINQGLTKRKPLGVAKRFQSLSHGEEKEDLCFIEKSINIED